MSIICNRCGKPLRDLSMGVFKDEKGYGVFINRGCDCVLRDPAIADQYETTNAIRLKFRLEECKAIDAEGNTIEMDPEKILAPDAPDGTAIASIQPEESQGQETIENPILDNLPKCSNCEAWMDERPAGENRGLAAPF